MSAAHPPPRFIDIHCHLLHGLDDGPKTLAISTHMCELAHASGTAAVVATPHANHRFVFDRRLTAERCARLQEQIASPLRLFAGCEVEASLETLPAALEDPAGYTLNGSHYLLVELMPAGMPPNIERVFSLLLDRGVTPIVAHPERNAQLQLDPERLWGWIQRGCLAQLTGDSLTGRMGRRAQAAAFHLLERRMIHFVASDGHDPLQRPPQLLRAYRIVQEIFSEELADLLFIYNPRAVVEDKPLPVGPAC